MKLVFPKRQYMTTRLHGAKSQKKVEVIVRSTLVMALLCLCETFPFGSFASLQSVCIGRDIYITFNAICRNVYESLLFVVIFMFVIVAFSPTL